MTPCALILLAIDGRPFDTTDSQLADHIAILEDAKNWLPNDDLGSVPLWRKSLGEAIGRLRVRQQGL